jgi:hypothetical protein
MTKIIPVLVDEQQAITAMAQEVERVMHKMTAQASREWLESNLRDFLQRDLIDRLEVIASADAGDEIAHAALGYVFHSMMEAGQTPPVSMVAYEARARLRGPNTRPAGAHTWDEKWTRNIGIAVLVYLTMERFGVNPTRNREQRRKRIASASSIVSAALGRAARINIAEKTVENIWGGLAGRLLAFVAARKMSPSILPN